ncbi:MAG: transposase [Opitutaceae bacterium]
MTTIAGAPPNRRTADLLLGRQSVPGASYFITWCEAARIPRLTQPEITSSLWATLEHSAAQSDFSPIAATIMPDHIHILGILGARLSLPRLIGKWKRQTGEVLGAKKLRWQENFYEHRLRRPEELEPFARYIFLNPHRARLLRLDESWPHWRRGTDTRFQFEEFVARDGRVPAAWLGEPDPPGASDL